MRTATPRNVGFGGFRIFDAVASLSPIARGKPIMKNFDGQLGIHSDRFDRLDSVVDPAHGSYGGFTSLATASLNSIVSTNRKSLAGNEPDYGGAMDRKRRVRILIIGCCLSIPVFRDRFGVSSSDGDE